MDNLFYLGFVFAICFLKMKTRQVTEEVLSCWDNFTSRGHFHTTTLATLHLCIWKLTPYFHTPRRA